MKVKYILSGDEKIVKDIIRESSIRIQRGWVEFAPLASEEEELPKDDKEVVPADTKEVKGDKKKSRK